MYTSMVWSVYLHTPGTRYPVHIYLAYAPPQVLHTTWYYEVYYYLVRLESTETEHPLPRALLYGTILYREIPWDE